MSLFARIGLALAALLSLTPATAAPPRDWTQVAVRTPSGSFVQGNPNAPVKLIEYLSLTCPHCAHFEEGAAAPLAAKYIRPGLVSYEVRIAIRDPFDLVAAILSRCAGPVPFFRVLPAVYAAQGDWEQKGGTWATTAPDLTKMGDGDAAKAVAKGSGLDVFFAAHGLPAARAGACLANADEQHLLSQRAQEYWNMPGFPGTPAFMIDGTMTAAVAEWAELDKLLAAAVQQHAHH